jgi:NAD(P)-dependent dehydrogenase (short-subunit alcohol dehydrogenase family)
MDPKGKVIVVIGASSGIGLVSARALGRAGAKVVLAARTQARIEEEAARLRAEGVNAQAVPMDVTDDASVRAAIDAVRAHHGRIDATICFAGNGGRLGPWEAADPDALRAMFDVHVFGAERVARAVLPVFRAQGGGTIVNVASTVAWVPMPMAAAYSAAKAAVLSLSESLRAELAPRGIDVVLFAPPHTKTEAGLAWGHIGAQTFEPEWVANELVRTLRRGRKTHLAAASNRMLLLIQRISPSLATKIMSSMGMRAGRRLLLAAPPSAW